MNIHKQFPTLMKKLNKNRPSAPTTGEGSFRRCHVTRVTSYASMASAISPGRAWSHAILWKIRNRTFHRCLMKRRVSHSLRRRGVLRKNPRAEFGFDEQVNDLRELVLGTRGMNFCSLLDETAHYIKCLEAQVEIMRKVLDHCST